MLDYSAGGKDSLSSTVVQHKCHNREDKEDNSDVLTVTGKVRINHNNLYANILEVVLIIMILELHNHQSIGYLDVMLVHQLPFHTYHLTLVREEVVPKSVVIQVQLELLLGYFALNATMIV